VVSDTELALRVIAHGVDLSVACQKSGMVQATADLNYFAVKFEYLRRGVNTATRSLTHAELSRVVVAPCQNNALLYVFDL
jgi:hypothetical protein